MNNLSQIVDLLESNFNKLLSEYEELKTENNFLKEQQQKLEATISEQRQVINDLKEEYETLKVANAIVGSKEDKHLTKLKINTLIREIDKCLVQLNE